MMITSGSIALAVMTYWLIFPMFIAVGLSAHGLPGPPAGEGGRSNRSTLLLEHHLKELRLPTFLREYRKLAAQCAADFMHRTFNINKLAHCGFIAVVVVLGLIVLVQGGWRCAWVVEETLGATVSS